MSVTINPSIQILVNDPATNPTQNVAAQTGNIGILCTNSGATMQDVVLPAATSALALPFPINVTTALVLYIAAITTTDLVVNITLGGHTVSLPPIPQGQGIVLYGLTSSQISISSVLGGQIQFAVGG